MSQHHICHFIGSLGSGGRETQILELIRRTNDKHTLCCLQGDSVLRSTFEEAGADVVNFDIKSGFHTHKILKILIYLRNSDIDLIHAHGPKAQVIARLAGEPSGINTIVSTHHGMQQIHDRYSLFFERLTRPLDSATVAVSEGVRSSFDSNGSTDHWHLIHNGIDVESFHQQVCESDATTVRSTLGIPEECTTILHIGRSIAEKRHNDIIRAISEVDTPVEFILIAGRGGSLRQLEELSKDLNVAQHVHFIERVPHEEIHSYYSAADMFVLASIREGLPIVLLEAMAAKLPIIGTDIPGVKEVIEYGKTGYLVPPRSPSRLANSISRMKENTRQTMGSAGYDRVKTEFDIEQTVNSYVSVYETAIQKRI
jgi:glycosyltransferase involved in cell wall biosynthesis